MEREDTREIGPSLEEVLPRAQPKIRQLFYRYRVPPEDAEDLLQQTLLAMVYKWREIERPEPWLLGTLRKKCLLYWRGRRRRLYDACDASLLELLAGEAQAPQERSAVICDLAAALSQIPSRCRRLLRLRYGLGLDPVELAERLGYSRASIGKLTTRCLAALGSQMCAGSPPAKRPARRTRRRRTG